MALNIANSVVEDKAICASRITGKNKTATVEIALDYFIQHHQTNDPTIVHKEVALILNEIMALPMLDDRSAEHILAYGETGLPE